MSELRETPLASRHRALGARMVPFAGWNMPVQYEGVLVEHTAVREACGIFDVGHMGTVLLSGPGAAALLQTTLTNDVSKVAPGRAQYTMLCNDAGGVVDDLIVSRLDDDTWMVVPNAGNVAAVVAVLEARCADVSGVTVEDVSAGWGILAVQGPLHPEVLAAALGDNSVGRFGVARFEADGHTGVLSGTGYTGSPGVEIVAPHATIVWAWDRMLPALEAVRGRPTGLGCRDTLRLEMGYPLHGQDISATISPIEAGLAWVVKTAKGDFPGRDVLARQEIDGAPRRLVGLVGEDRRPPRSHCDVVDSDGRSIGEVTSGNFSPGLGRGIALALVEAGSHPAAIDIRGKAHAVEVVTPPFVDLA